MSSCSSSVARFSPLVIIGSFSTLLSAASTTAGDWFNFIVYGVALGGIYAVIAIGYTMVYGILRMINFAHSEVFMSGPLTAYFLADAWGRSGFLDQNPVLGLLVIFALAMAISMVGRRSAGAHRLSSAALCAAPGAADHRDWRILLSAIFLPWSVRREHQSLS